MTIQINLFILLFLATKRSISANDTSQQFKFIQNPDNK